jgi:two-component system, sensor histidine kinase PdtaS
MPPRSPSSDGTGNTGYYPELAEDLGVFGAISIAMAEAPTLEAAAAAALRTTLERLYLDSGKVYLLDIESQKWVLSAALTSELAAQEPQVQTLCACMAAPLFTGRQLLGFLYVTSRKEEEFSEARKALLRAVGAQIGILVENERLREAAQRAEALATLIQEMHHRIKNNLQTVADLLSLEMSTSPSPAARKSLRDSISRIKSIAAVHELLSLEQLRLTDITELARQVCDISLSHLVRPDRLITADINGPAIYLPSKQATALALAMNELIGNALEHAFSLSGRDGRLTIVTAQDGAQVTIAISDNGRGLPPDFDLVSRRGLGLQIAQTLVEKDLAGTLRLENNPSGGVRATLTFYK